MKAAAYSWGEFKAVETISKQNFKQMRRLTEQEMLGFLIRKEDKNKIFYGPEEYIDSGADGIAVKFAYAIKNKSKLKSKKSKVMNVVGE
jgi:hypothetical protein